MIRQCPARTGISIHALLAESDRPSGACYPVGREYFYPRSPCGERRIVLAQIWPYGARFLSTLSLRRATMHVAFLSMSKVWISIHALLAESDRACGEDYQRPVATISIHALLAESDGTCATWHAGLRMLISIHALLAESDIVVFWQRLAGTRSYFYPRSPCGERPVSRHWHGGKPGHFYPRSPCGERRITPSIFHTETRNFYPRSPCGERPGQRSLRCQYQPISIHALLAESDQ